LVEPVALLILELFARVLALRNAARLLIVVDRELVKIAY
jgi:hypothetical protein